MWVSRELIVMLLAVFSNSRVKRLLRSSASSCVGKCERRRFQVPRRTAWTEGAGPGVGLRGLARPFSVFVSRGHADGICGSIARLSYSILIRVGQGFVVIQRRLVDGNGAPQ